MLIFNLTENLVLIQFENILFGVNELCLFWFTVYRPHLAVQVTLFIGMSI